MNKTLSNFILAAIIGLIFVNCANRGRPGGGPEDITPPVIVKTIPENRSINFDGNEIKIYFDEYVVMKDLQKQLIISPPMTTQPEITPAGSASKYITIKIHDTLQPNTTYAFNFGNSITDNNEGNPYPYYRYVFSTGDYIDSLTVKGKIVDALKTEPATFVSVALYEIDSTFTDSIIYKEKPKYITNTLDSLTTFSIENIKAGKYMLMALKDGNGDNKFQQKTDQVAFYKSPINVPTDSLYTLKLFSEELDYKAVKPRLIAGGKIAFGYEGDNEGMKIKLLSEVPEGFTYRITKDEKTDSLYYWFKPRLELDSLVFNVSHPNFNEDFTVRLTKQKRDSLTIKTSPSRTIGYDENFSIRGSIPFTAFDESKVSIMDKKDSINVDFKTSFDSITNTYSFKFDKTEDNSYKVTTLPDVFEGFFPVINDTIVTKKDTLRYSLRTKTESEFGYARFKFVNATYPLIVQLTNIGGEVQVEQYVKNDNGTVNFLNLEPSKYLIRIIHDTNGNKKYDTGSYLKKIQPERVSHFKEIEIRADWGEEQTLTFK